MANAYQSYRNKAAPDIEMPERDMFWNARKKDIADHGRAIYRALGGYEGGPLRNDTVTLNKLLKMKRQNIHASLFSPRAYSLYKSPMSKKLLETLQRKMDANMRDAANAELPYLGKGEAPWPGTRLVRPKNIVKVFKRLKQYETQHRKEAIARFEAAMAAKFGAKHTYFGPQDPNPYFSRRNF